MSLDAETSTLTKFGKVVIHPHGDPGGVQIEVLGFDGKNCSCRDVAVQACLWAIGELQREVLRCIEEPGGGSIGIA